MARLLALSNPVARSVVAVFALTLAARPGLGAPPAGPPEPPANSRAVPLEQVLQPDGTLDLHGYRGSVTTAGWRMRMDADGAPRFERAGARAGGTGPATQPCAPKPLGDAPAPPACWIDRFGSVGSPVSAAAVSGSGDLYAAHTGATHIGKWDGTTWSGLGTGLNGNANALAIDGSGNLFAGGSFTTAGGVSVGHIAKWNGASWSALGTGMDNFVYALAMDGSGNLYAGGNFITAGGASANRVAKWNGTTWSALSTGMNGPVNALAVDGGILYAGGDFTSAGGVSCSYIAKWNGTSWSALGTGTDGSVRALAMDGNGNLFAGGNFGTAGGVSANFVAKWNGTSWSALGTGTNNTVNVLVMDAFDEQLYLGGYFTAAGGVSANYVARWDGGNWWALGTGVSSIVGALAVDGGGNLYAGGDFTTAGGMSAKYVAKWDQTSWSAPSMGANNTVNTLAVDGGGNLYAGGDFTTVGGGASRIAKWNGTISSALGTGTNSSVLALAKDGDGNLCAGGYFTTAGGVSANYVAKWNGTSWSALGTGMNNLVYDLAVDGSGNLYAGGYFTTAGGVSASYVAKWDGTSWSALGTGMNDYVGALAVDGGGNLYAGGGFTTAGGASANYVAKWDGTSWSALGTGMNNPVGAMVVGGGGDLFAGGGFTNAGGVSANHVAKWNGTSWSALGTGMNSNVDALAVDGGGRLFAGGSFTTAGLVAANYIAMWNGAYWWNLDTGMNDAVSALALDGGDLYAGGEFTSAGGIESDHLAGLHLNFFFPDADHDGYGDPTRARHSCTTSLSGYVTDNTDCDDTDPRVHPGAAETLCDGIDNDCDATVDEDAGSCGCVENRPGLAGWWRGENSPTDAAAGNHGTLIGGAGYAPGMVGQAFSLNGTDAYVANLGDAYSYAFIENTGVFTINAWINLDDVNALSEQAITGSTATTSEKGHYFTWLNLAGEQRLSLWLAKGISGDPVISSDSPDHVITTSGWHHVAAVGNGTTVTFYVDGVGYPGTGTMTSKPSGPSLRAVDIGRCPYATPLCLFSGLIDELQICDRALTASEIGAIHDAGANGMCGTGCMQSLTGLRGWWPGSGDAGDRSAFNNHGATGGGLIFTTGKVGQAFSPGSSGYVDVPDSPSLEMPTQFTLAAWILPTAVNNSARIISKFGAGSYAYEMLFSSNNNMQPRADISNDGINSDALVSPTSLSVGDWAHVATTFNLGAWKLYVNGSEVASTVSAMITIFVGGSSPLSIGRVPSAGNNFLGRIDEPMVFNRALSAGEIQAIYNAGSSGVCGLVLVGMDEPETRTGPLEFAAPWPNPAVRMTNVRFRLPAAAVVHAEVFDVAGRRVTSLMDGKSLDAGEHRLTWDGRDASGRRAAGGIYQIRVTAGGAVAVRRIVMIE